MATGTKFQQFIEDLHHGVHDLETDQLMIALCNAANAPSASADAVLADLTQISYTNLLNNPTSRQLTTSTSAQTSGTYVLTLADLTISASGGALPTFRYVVFYNDTPTSPADPLIALYDHGGDVDLADGESYTVDQLGNLISAS
jgi:hypothetical protein